MGGSPSPFSLLPSPFSHLPPPISHLPSPISHLPPHLCSPCQKPVNAGDRVRPGQTVRRSGLSEDDGGVTQRRRPATPLALPPVRALLAPLPPHFPFAAPSMRIRTVDELRSELRLARQRFSPREIGRAPGVSHTTINLLLSDREVPRPTTAT